MDELDA